MASEPLLVPFLVGLGVRELSMAPRLAPLVRKVLVSFTLKEMEEIAKKVLEAQSAQEVYIILRSYYAMVGYES
jgi:phosphoenolpyruvate-protein kinase (PTS system EI component)